MYNTEEKVQYESNDIDLFYIIRKIVRFIKESLVVLIIAFVFGVAAGFTFYKITPPVYTSTLTAFSLNLPDTKIKDMTDELQAIIKERDYQHLASILDLPVDQIEKIKRIEVILNKDLGESLSPGQGEFQNAFGLRVTVSDQTVLDLVRNAYINFIGNNNYVKKKMRLYKETLNSNLKTIQSEIDYIENMKASLQDLMQSNNTRSNLFISDIGSLSARLLELQIAKNELINKIEFTQNDITVVKDFVKFKKPSSPKLSFSLAGGVIIAMFVSLSVLVIIRLSRL
jgi:hypothetical protein